MSGQYYAVAYHGVVSRYDDKRFGTYEAARANMLKQLAAGSSDLSVVFGTLLELGNTNLVHKAVSR